jgi:hypothetical protein
VEELGKAHLNWPASCNNRAGAGAECCSRGERRLRQGAARTREIQITVDTCGQLIPGANRGTVSRLDDDDAAQPSAIQAQRDPSVGDIDGGDDAELLEESGEPKFSRVEPIAGLAQTNRPAQARGMILGRFILANAVLSPLLLVRRRSAESRGLPEVGRRNERPARPRSRDDPSS